jgi:hypothetical protein
LIGKAEFWRRWNPKFAWPEKRFGKHDAANVRIIIRRKLYTAISPDSFTHFVYGSDPIRFSKAVPCQAQWKVKKPREKATTRDEVQWRMQFEKHQFAWLERLKIGCRRWTPEIDFFHLRAGCVEIKPVLIRYGNEYSHSWC